MNYTEFVNAVEEKMNLKLKGGEKVTLYTALKNNGTERKGVMIEVPDVNVSPTIYLEEFYSKYQEGKTIDGIVDELIELYEEIRQDQSWDYEKVLSFEGVKDRIVFKLINTQQNQMLLERVPHRKLLDLSLVFYVLFEANCEETAAMMITNAHAERWEVDEGMLWNVAVENCRRLLPAECFTMNYAMCELMGVAEHSTRVDNDLLVAEKTERDRMYVLSNKVRNFGAACIAYPYVLEMIGEILKEDFYVLPSSVHEVVIVPSSGGICSYEMDEMIREINETQVLDEEILSDHAYYFDHISRELRMRRKESFREARG